MNPVIQMVNAWATIYQSLPQPIRALASVSIIALFLSLLVNALLHIRQVIMEGLAIFWATFFGWMPPLFAGLFFAFVAFTVVIIVLKLVAFVMDVLPFV